MTSPLKQLGQFSTISYGTVEMGLRNSVDDVHDQPITKTYNFYPLKPHFYIVKLGFTGVDIIFLISAQ